MAVTFDNIAINDCYELVNGKIELVVDPNKQLLDVDDAWEGMQDLLAQTEARIETAQTSIDKILALNKNATANKQAILDELAKLKPTIDSLLADDCRTQAFKDSILREYNEMVAYAQSRNARLAATNADNPITKYLTSWAERLLTPVLMCVIDKSNFPQLINLIVQETEYKKSLLRVNSAGVTGDTKCNLLFVEGFVHQFFGNLDAIGLSEAIAKVGVDKLKGFLEYIKNCSNSSVTGQSYFENCLLNEPLLIKPTVDAFQMTKGLYDVVSTSVGEAYSCTCWDQNGAVASVECAHIRGQITGFVASAVLEEILTGGAASTWLAVRAASIAKKSIRKVEALVVNGKTILTKTNLKTADFRKWINNKSVDLTEVVKKALGKGKFVAEITQETIDEIFKGKISKIPPSEGQTQPSFKAIGVHHKLAISNRTAGFVEGDVRISNITPIDANGIYQAKVEIYHPDLIPINGTGWKVKYNQGGKSTFFPDKWSQNKVLEEISYAFNRKSLLTGNKYKSYTSNGIELHFYLDSSGNISTVFPIYKP
ncbi:EndoU domain-containing protein [Runella limosa]|uniref:EndoU domain-containing protein n=1 Tax=Runella limosa TaxID=370978 RepID=UPI00146F9683|nr:EndoU domain-containing protein [Runella limosa]